MSVRLILITGGVNLQIIACIKQVPDTAEVKIDRETNTLIREGVPSIINPFDLNAVEEGLLLRERFGGTVTVISMGHPRWRQPSGRPCRWGSIRPCCSATGLLPVLTPWPHPIPWPPG